MYVIGTTEYAGLVYVADADKIINLSLQFMWFVIEVIFLINRDENKVVLPQFGIVWMQQVKDRYS